MEAVKENIDVLWDEYFLTRSSETKNKLILNYIWLVKFALSKMSLPTNSILENNDFLTFGILGLNETIERFSAERGVKFESYAIPRIKGIIKDELRKLDWLSRNARKKAHEYLAVVDELQNEEGREVSPDEMMKKLGVDAPTFQKYLNAAAVAKASLSFNESSSVIVDGEELDIFDTVADEDSKSSLEALEDKERVDFLVDYLGQLKQKPRLVMSLYYYEEMTFKEIGETLELTESRVCQIHSKVIKDMRQKLSKLEYA